jgi:hypothetical protein
MAVFWADPPQNGKTAALGRAEPLLPVDVLGSISTSITGAQRARSHLKKKPFGRISLSLLDFRWAPD